MEHKLKAMRLNMKNEVDTVKPFKSDINEEVRMLFYFKRQNHKNNNPIILYPDKDHIEISREY